MDSQIKIRDTSPGSRKKNLNPKRCTETKTETLVWRSPDKQRKVKLEQNKHQRQNNRDDKEIRLRSIGVYDKYLHPQTSIEEIKLKIRDLCGNDIDNEANTYLHKLVEDIICLVQMLARSRDRGDYFTSISVFAKLRINKPLFSLENFQSLGEMLQNVFDEIMGLMPQSGNPFAPLRSILDNFESIRSLPIFQKLYKFIMYIMCTSILDKVGVKFSKSIFEKLHITAMVRKQYTLGIDFVHCMMDTIVFLCETGYQCFVLGSVQPLFHSGNAYSDWMDEAYELKRLSNFSSNLEIHGIKKCDYLYRLKVAIEKGVSILNQVKVKSPTDSRLIRGLLSEITYIRDSELTRKMASATRPAPFAVLLYGGSGIGKSLFCELILHYYQQIFGLPAGDEFIFTRNAADPFWNNFGTHCWGLVLDDVAFLDPKVVMGGDPTMLEMLQIINNVPYTPPQADLCDKGKTPLMCKVVVATTNTQHLNTVGQFSCPLAVQRRMPYVIDLQPKKVFSKDSVFLDPEKAPLPEKGELPNMWEITVKRVLPANSDRNHQMAKFEVVQTFDDIKEFLAWFGSVAKQHDINQKKATLTADVFKDIKFCETCHKVVSECQCLHLQADDKTEWFRKEIMEKYLLPDENKDLNSYEFFFQIVCIKVKFFVDLPWLRVCLLCLLVIAATFGDWDHLVLILFLIFGVYYIDYKVSYAQCFKWGMRHPICRAKLRSRVKHLGKKIEETLSNSFLKRVGIACSALCAGGAAYHIYRKLTRPKLSEQSVDDFGAHELEPTGDTFNPWYNDSFELSRFDMTPRSLSYKALSTEQLDKVVSNNAVCFVLRSEHNGITKKTTNRAYCVGDHLYLTNAHAIPDGVFKLDIISQCSNNLSSNVSGITVSPSMVYVIKERDIGFIYLRCRPPMKNMQNLFCTEALKGKYKGYYISRGVDGNIIRRTVANIEFKESLRNDALGTEVSSWMGRVSVPTQIGDCGSILLGISPQGPIILGIHYLGGLDIVAATKVDVSIIDEAFKHFDAIIVEPAAPIISSQSATNVLGPLHKKSVFRYIDKGLAKVYGTFEGFRPARKSDVKDTILRLYMEKHGYTTKYHVPDLSGYLPWRTAALSMVNPAVKANSDVLKECIESYKQDILSRLPQSEIDRIKVIDLHLATNGAPGVKFIDGIKRSTSAGFPWNKSKKYFLSFIGDSQEVEFNPEIKSRVEVILEKYSRGELYAPVFTGSLKDEPTKKKVRLFCGAPICWSLVVRMFMLTLVQVIQRNPLIFEAAPGTVVQSMTWQRFYEFLTFFSDTDLICGDYGEYDKHMATMFILGCFDIYVAICIVAKWSFVDVRGVRCIGEDVAFAWINFNGDLVQFMNVNPAGWPLTVIINSMCNSVYMRYCYFVLNPRKEVRTFIDNVHLLTYGDDNIMNVSSEAKWFNHTAISEALANIGVKYTMADKEAESVPYVPISEASFLKRTWRFDTDVGCHLAPLSEESIIKSLMICVSSKSISAEHQAMEIISAAHREYFNYGKEKFHKMEIYLRNMVEEVGLSDYVVDSSFPTWEHLKNEFIKASESLGMKLEPQSQEEEEELCRLLEALPLEIQTEIMHATPCACKRCLATDCPHRFSDEDDLFLICMICEKCFEMGEPCHEQIYCDFCLASAPNGGLRIDGEIACIECALEMIDPDLNFLQPQSDTVVSVPFDFCFTQLPWQIGVPIILIIFLIESMCIGAIIGSIYMACARPDRFMILNEMDKMRIITFLLVFQLVKMFFNH